MTRRRAERIAHRCAWMRRRGHAPLGVRPAAGGSIRSPRQETATRLRNGLGLTLDLPFQRGPTTCARPCRRGQLARRLGHAVRERARLRKQPLASPPSSCSGDGEPPDPDAAPSVRRFRGGSSLAYPSASTTRSSQGSGQPKLSACSSSSATAGDGGDAHPRRLTLAAQQGVTAVSGAPS